MLSHRRLLGITRILSISALVPTRRRRSKKALFRVHPVAGNDAYQAGAAARGRPLAPGASLSHTASSSLRVSQVVSAAAASLRSGPGPWRNSSSGDWGKSVVFPQRCSSCWSSSRAYRRAAFSILAIRSSSRRSLSVRPLATGATILSKITNPARTEALKEATQTDPASCSSERHGPLAAGEDQPAEGCLPMRRQIPFFYSLSRADRHIEDLLQAPFDAWGTTCPPRDPTINLDPVQSGS